MLVLLMSLFACSSDPVAEPVTPPAVAAATGEPQVRLVFTSRGEGEIEPCG